MNALSAALDRWRTVEFPLDQLASVASDLLRRLGVAPGDARVARAFDERSVRFYQTAGLLDRPLRYDGRRAVYGFRHLVQLLAVKRLQQEGHPLALVQRALAGRSTREIEEALATAAAGPRARPASDARPPARPGGPPPVPAREARSLVAAEVAPGITLTIDPARVGGSEDILAQVSALLARIMEVRQ